jgi:dephospho-CoA kinase
VDRILVVDCSEQRQVQRVMQRSGWSREEVERVIAQQSERRVRRSVADAVIDNEADGLDALRASVGLVFAHWCAAARERSAPAQPPLA